MNVNSSTDQGLDALEERYRDLARRAAAGTEDAGSLLRDALAELAACTEELRRHRAELARSRSDAAAHGTAPRPDDARSPTSRVGPDADHDLLELLPSPACRFSRETALLYANRAWREYTGVSPEDLSGAGWRALVDPCDLPRLMRFHEHGARERQIAECEFGFRRADGAYRRHRAHFRQLTDETGGVEGWVAVFTDVEHQHETEDRLRTLYADARRTLERLRDSIAMKDEFLGLISHELKGPITTVLGNAEVLLRHGTQISEDARAAALGDVHDDAERLHRIVEDLLSLSRLERNAAVTLEPIMLGHVIEAVVGEHRRRYPTRPVELAIDADGRPALGERLYIEQVLRNLLSNAEKYSPSELPIAITLRAASDEVEVSVADRGAGLSQEEAGLVFEPFVRLSRTAADVSGNGVGLTVCKRLIEAQGGRIAARPREGGGCVFSFALPCTDEPTDDD